MGRLVAELLNQNCTGVYLPGMNYLIPNEISLRDRLRSFQTLEDLQSTETMPVPVVEDDDPRLAAIVARARAEWPEFVTAFGERTREDDFLVKAFFGDSENGEWMWLEVAALPDGYVVGNLHNSPVVVQGIVQGDEVKIRETDIGDWYYVHNGCEHGGFSKALFD